MRVRKRTIALLATLALVGVLGVALASVALGKAAAPRVDTGDLAGIGEVVWGPGSGPLGARAVDVQPVVSGLSPTKKAVGSSGFQMTVSGSSFVATTTVLWNGGELTNVLLPTATAITVSVPAVRVGAYSLVNVTVKTGSLESTPTAFTITQPTIGSVAPTSTPSGVTLNVTLTGTFLKEGLDAPQLALKGTGANSGTTIAGSGVIATAETTMVGAFNLAAPTIAPSGVYDVVLAYGASGLVTKAGALTIDNPVPVITTISPTTVYAGSAQPLLLTVNGTGFAPGASGSAIKFGAAATLSTTFVSASELTAPLTTVATATVGAVPITVVNPAPGGGTSNAVNLTVAGDTTAPVTTIAGADSAWHTEDVVLTVAATDAQSGVQKTQYALNTTSPAAVVGGTITVPADGTFEGVTNVVAWSTDWCGNVEDPGAAVTVKIDTVGPRTSAYPPATVKAGKKARAIFGYRANDVTPKCSITLKIKKKTNGKTVRSYALGNKSTGVRLNYTVRPNLAIGTYVLYVYATDQAGLKQSKLGYKTFKVK